MSLRSELEKLDIGHPLTVMNTDERGHTHDLRATFQGLTGRRVKIRYVAGNVDSHCKPEKVIIRPPKVAAIGGKFTFNRKSFTEERKQQYMATFSGMSDGDFIAEVLRDQVNWCNDRCVGEREYADGDAEYEAMKDELTKRFNRRHGG